MIKLATVFSGIGAIEHALDRMQLEHEIVFACDNGDVELEMPKVRIDVDSMERELEILKKTIKKVCKKIHDEESVDYATQLDVMVAGVENEYKKLIEKLNLTEDNSAIVETLMSEVGVDIASAIQNTTASKRKKYQELNSILESKPSSIEAKLFFLLRLALTLDEDDFVSSTKELEVIYDTDYFKRLHECVITECSKQLGRSQLDELFDIDTVELSEETLLDFGDRDYVLERLHKELNVQFNTRRQILLKTIYTYISQENRMLEENDGISMFGTTAYHAVWEKVCATVFDNKLNTTLGQLKMSVPLAEEYKSKSKETLINIIEKPKWKGTDMEEQDASDTLIPDLISVPQIDGVDYFLIFDAKYYNIQLEKGKSLRGNPGVSDVTKKYLYQLAYRHFIKAHNIAVVKNCFLMPTEKDEIINKGTARMPMLEALGLENIQIRLMPATSMYEHYLAQKKIDISLLEL